MECEGEEGEEETQSKGEKKSGMRKLMTTEW